MAGRDVQGIGAGSRGPERHLLAFGVGHAAGEIVVDRDAKDHRHAAHRGLDRAQHVEPEARAVFERAAVVVGAPVLERGEELRDQVAVGGVDLDAIEAGLLRARGGLRERRHRRGDARARHFLRHDGLVGDLVDRMRNRGRRHRRLAADVAPRMPAAMAELDRRLGAAAMDRIDEAREAGQEAVVIDAELAPAVAAGAFRARPSPP